MVSIRTITHVSVAGGPSPSVPWRSRCHLFSLETGFLGNLHCVQAGQPLPRAHTLQARHGSFWQDVKLAAKTTGADSPGTGLTSWDSH